MNARGTECRCDACGVDVTPVRPSPYWKVANLGVWTFIMVAGPFLAVMPPLNLVTIPIFVFAALAMVGAVSDKLAQPPSCPRCERDIAREHLADQRASRRNSPGVLPVQRTKAL